MADPKDKVTKTYDKNQADRAGKALDKVKVDPERMKTRNAIMNRDTANPLDDPGMSEGYQGIEGGSDPVRLVVDQAGNVTHIDPTTGATTKIPGKFSQLVDSFDELAKSGEDMVGNAVDKARGLLSSPAAQEAGSVAEKAAGVGGRMLSPATLAFLQVMSPTPANAGEDEQLDAQSGHTPSDNLGAGNTPPSMNGDQLDDQTSQAMPGADKGINPAAKATRIADTAPNPRPNTEIGQSMPQAATMTDNVTGKRGVNTAGGFYPQFDKGSVEASDFRSAFAKAIAGKANTFMWQGREYTTDVAPTKKVSN